MGNTIRIPTERQGQTGMGQGGYACFALGQVVDPPVTFALKNALPLETDLDVVQVDDETWQLIDPSDPDTVLIEAKRWTPHYAVTTAVSTDEAHAARARFPLSAEDHPVPHCLSCGIGERTLRVHAGPLEDGRWATPWRAPAWSLLDDGSVDESLLWMGVDCSCGWYTSHAGVESRRGLTVQFAVDVYEPLRAETDYALVAWHGDYAPNWDGRKRGAAAMLFDNAGSPVAQSRSFWVAVA